MSNIFKNVKNRMFGKIIKHSIFFGLFLIFNGFRQSKTS